MPLDLTFLGHSTFLMSDGTHRLCVDPFLADNPVAAMKPDDVECQYVALTHGHPDHMADAEPIAKRNNATVVAPYEICDYLAEQGVASCEPANPGGRITTDFGWIAFTPAVHSSSFQGRYMGEPCGIVVHMGGHTVYHMGDTTLFSDMRLIGELYQPEVALVPIGDRFTMDAEIGAKAAELVGAPTAIPIHYKTFPMLADSAAGFAPKGVEVKELQPGETHRLG